MMTPNSSVAMLLDDVRQLIAAAYERGENPQHILLARTDFDAVAEIKRPELARNMPMMILGMEIVLSDDPQQKPALF